MRRPAHLRGRRLARSRQLLTQFISSCASVLSCTICSPAEAQCAAISTANTLATTHFQTGRQTDGRTDGLSNRANDGRTDKRMHREAQANRPTDKPTNRSAWRKACIRGAARLTYTSVSIPVTELNTSRGAIRTKSKLSPPTRTRTRTTNLPHAHTQARTFPKPQPIHPTTRGVHTIPSGARVAEDVDITSRSFKIQKQHQLRVIESDYFSILET